MSNHPNMTLWARPAWSADRFVRDFFGPASATDWFKPLPAAFNPAAEIAKDGDDAVVRLELPGIDISRDVNVDVEDGRLVIHGERRDEHAPEDPAKDARVLREVRYGAYRRSFALPEHITATTHRVLPRRCADRAGGRCAQGAGSPWRAAHPDRKQLTTSQATL